MSRVLTAKDITARALRAIGAFPVTDSAPDGEQTREAMHWLDLILSELVGTESVFSRVPATLSMSITNGTQSYDLYSALGSDLPTDGIQYVTEAYLEDSAGNRVSVEIVTRETFENVPNLAETGVPTRVYIDRLARPTLQIFPTPATTDSTVWALKLVGQKYAPNVAPGGVTGVTPSGTSLHELGVSWQRWLILQLSHDLGSGPIHKLPETSLNRFSAGATLAKARLLAFENRQHENSDPICEAWGM